MTSAPVNLYHLNIQWTFERSEFSSSQFCDLPLDGATSHSIITAKPIEVTLTRVVQVMEHILKITNLYRFIFQTSEMCSVFFLPVFVTASESH